MDTALRAIHQCGAEQTTPMNIKPPVHSHGGFAGPYNTLKRMRCINSVINELLCVAVVQPPDGADFCL